MAQRRRYGALALRLESGSGGNARLEVMDVAGRVRARRALALTAGESRALALEETKSLPSGLYIVSLVAGSERRTARALLLR